MKNSQAPILNGKSEAEKMFLDLKKKIAKLKVKPTLAVILVGHDSASKIYVGLKEKRAQELGVNFIKYYLPTSVSEKKIINLIQELNNHKKITGILLQLPLPKKLNTNKIISVIDRKKDVDGLNPPIKKSADFLMPPLSKGGTTTTPPTIQSILHLIKLSKQKLVNKKAVILCHNQEFAESIKRELKRKNLRVDICLNNKITNYKLQITDYDIIIIALGKKYFLKPVMLKKNAIIIDVGINKIKNKIYGDVDPKCLAKTKYISPVPGGVGPLTVAYLFKNLVKLSKLNQ